MLRTYTGSAGTQHSTAQHRAGRAAALPYVSMASGRKGRGRVRGAAVWRGQRCSPAATRLGDGLSKSRAEQSSAVQLDKRGGGRGRGRGSGRGSGSERQRSNSDSDSASGRGSRGRPGCEGQLSRWAVETNVAMDIRLGCGGSERSGKVQVSQIESMVVRRRELIQYGGVAGGKRSVAVAAVRRWSLHGTAASFWCAQPRRVSPVAAVCPALPCAGAGAAARYG